MGFRSKLLTWIYNQLCQLIIDEPEISYQNDISGYSDLNNLNIGDKNSQISKIGSNVNNRYFAPRQPNTNFNTPLRKLYNRPITQNDVSGLRTETKQRGNADLTLPLINTPSAFLHIVTAEKDLYFPSRRIPAEGRLRDQIEFLKIGVDCVLRDETEPIPGTGFQGNGKFWKKQIEDCVDPIEFPVTISTIPPTTPPYRPLYYRSINHQAADFVEDTERILNATAVRDLRLSYGPNNEAEARVMNIILGIWGMLPDSENSPTDTVRCIFELEVHYPKVPGFC